MFSLALHTLSAPKPFVRHARGYVRQPTPAGEAITTLNVTDEMVAAMPRSVDWAAKGALSPVKDQGACGSCWAFSTTEGVESAVWKATGSLPPPLSTEQLVDCEKQDDGCDGGGEGPRWRRPAAARARGETGYPRVHPDCHSDGPQAL